MADRMHAFMAFDVNRITVRTLVFARDARSARPIGFCLAMAQADVDYSEIRVQRIRGDAHDWLMSLANERLTAAGLAHGTDTVPTCSCCETWRPLLDGRCAECAQLAQEESNA